MGGAGRKHASPPSLSTASKAWTAASASSTARGDSTRSTITPSTTPAIGSIDGVGEADLVEQVGDRLARRRGAEPAGDPVAVMPSSARPPRSSRPAGSSGTMRASQAQTLIQCRRIIRSPIDAGDRVVGVVAPVFEDRLQVGALDGVVAGAGRIMRQRSSPTTSGREDVRLVGALVDRRAAELGEPDGLPPAPSRSACRSRRRPGGRSGRSATSCGCPCCGRPRACHTRRRRSACGSGVAVGGAGIVPVVIFAALDVRLQVVRVVDRWSGRRSRRSRDGRCRRASRPAAGSCRCRRSRCRRPPTADRGGR